MNWTLAPLDAALAVPWRNGGGVTRELLAWPADGEWRIRVSVADITQAGPFSAFPGIRRHFLVLEGAGVHLAIDGVGQPVTPTSPPVAFDGAADVAAVPIAGATRDLNFMVRGGAGALRRLADTERIDLRADWVGIYAHEHPLLLRSGDGGRVTVPPRTLAWQDVARPGPLEATGRGMVWMEA